MNFAPNYNVPTWARDDVTTGAAEGTGIAVRMFGENPSDATGIALRDAYQKKIAPAIASAGMPAWAGPVAIVAGAVALLALIVGKGSPTRGAKKLASTVGLKANPRKRRSSRKRRAPKRRNSGNKRRSSKRRKNCGGRK